jgi:uncharacterized protein YndB with AHSA1/START domain
VTHDVLLEFVLDASPTELFDAFIDPDAIQSWWQVDASWEVNVVVCDVRRGGSTRITFGPPGATCTEDMSYTEVERPHRLRFIDDFTTPDGSTTRTEVTVTFEATGAKTLMTLVQAGFLSADRRDRHQNGWPRFVERLDRAAIERLP